jgi:inosine-uridine nucleoside N-ribohydrolase
LRHVIIDTDPGVDDALALILAFGSPELSIEGLTTVVGNISHAKAHCNALKLLEFLNVREVPVAPGAVKPLIRRPLDASEFHGETGLGEAVLPEPQLRSDDRSAVELILDKYEELGKKLTIIAIGPLTNIASTLLVEPELAKSGSDLIIMGGAFNVTPYGFGNVTPVAEFNIWHDPEAAKIVFNSGIPIKAIGLDVTTHPENRLSKEHFEEIRTLDTRRARIVFNLCSRSIRRFGSLSLHDPLAVAAASDPNLVDTERFHVDVETWGELTRGQTVTDRRGSRHVHGREELNIDVCVSVNSNRFLKLFMDRVVQR